MKIQAICIGNAEHIDGKKTKTGILKHRVGGSVIVDSLGIAGDAVVNRKHHGGPEQALLIDGSITLDWWASELGRALEPGTFGENLVIEGLDNRDVAAGDRFHCNEVVLEVTSARIPCSTFALRMGDSRFVKRYFDAGRPGIYVRVLKPGMMAAGEMVRYEAFNGPRVTMPEMMAKYGKALNAEDRERYLAAPVNAKIRDAILAG